jgi:hypothetical protein
VKYVTDLQRIARTANQYLGSNRWVSSPRLVAEIRPEHKVVVTILGSEEAVLGTICTGAKIGPDDLS